VWRAAEDLCASGLVVLVLPCPPLDPGDGEAVGLEPFTSADDPTAGGVLFRTCEGREYCNVGVLLRDVCPPSIVLVVLAVAAAPNPTMLCAREPECASGFRNRRSSDSTRVQTSTACGNSV